MLLEILKGGRGSGNFGHGGRPGKRGGSGGGGGKGKPRRGRRSREVLDKEIEAGKKPKKTEKQDQFHKELSSARSYDFSGNANGHKENSLWDEYSSAMSILKPKTGQAVNNYSASTFFSEDTNTILRKGTSMAELDKIDPRNAY